MKNIYCTKTFAQGIFLNMIVMFLLSSIQVKAQYTVPPASKPVCAYCGTPLPYGQHETYCKYYVSGSSGSTNNSSNINPVDFSFTNPISSGFQVGTLGALAGGLLVKGKTGEELWLEGAAFGFGIGSTLALFNSLNKRSVVANMALAVISGSANGFAAAKLEKAFTEPTVPTEPAKPDNTVKYVVIAAVAETALVTTISLVKKPKGGYSYWMNKHNFLSKMNVNFYGNRVGLLVKL